ncbi:unnamed protein product [Ranitomeya imitator]|uniref:long-chain-fatty-acid--CoA ligase n=1 Tax=Ranitomeya imitator TaxID=111125 RepID=A0ABN9LRB3_9NEOB|nr:unnamed protein product [Ranitomeya imitator]
MCVTGDDTLMSYYMKTPRPCMKSSRGDPSVREWRLSRIPKNQSAVSMDHLPQVVIAELACFSYSMVVVPLYDTLGAEAIVFIVNRADLSLIVCDKHLQSCNFAP